MRSLDIINNIRKGNSQQALQYTYNYCKAYCVRKLLAYASCRVEDAEDIFMDSILIFRDNILSGKLTELKHPRKYLYTICLNRWREQQREYQKKQREQNAIQDNFYDAESDPEQTEEDLQRKKAVVMQAFSYLGESCQNILHDYYFSGMSLADIAQKMQFASSNVAKVTKSRCYQKWMRTIKMLQEKENEQLRRID